MTKTGESQSPSPAAAKPYHHGDLRRGLIEAARAILERDGPQALSLRAVAREAGVSPAAPYHHFKDKNELLNAVADEGFRDLSEAMRKAFEADPGHHAAELGVAYVIFARANPALYRVMYDCARDEESMPEKAHEEEDAALNLVKQALIRAGADPNDIVGLSLSCIAAWCTAHGVAEMAGFAQFKPVIAAVGGEEAFVRGLLARVSIFASVPGRPDQAAAPAEAAPLAAAE